MTKRRINKKALEQRKKGDKKMVSRKAVIKKNSSKNPKKPQKKHIQHVKLLRRKDTYLFRTAGDIFHLCRHYKIPISEVALRYEMEIADRTEEEVWEKMRKVARIMKEAIKSGIKNPKQSVSKLSGGDGKKIRKYGHVGNPYTNEIGWRAMEYAIATGETNASMGRIAAFPTAGGAGVIPGVILAIAKVKKYNEEKMLRGLLCASAIGVIIAENATLSAAAAGCQAEVGVANACAAAAAVEMNRGTPSQAIHAAALAMKSSLGLVCDPLGGLVEVPCIMRNALGSQHALGAADLAMAGIKSHIPFDEVVSAMYSIGKTMSSTLKETALGGLAVTPTGLRIRKKLGLPVLRKKDILPENKTQIKHKKTAKKNSGSTNSIEKKNGKKADTKEKKHPQKRKSNTKRMSQSHAGHSSHKPTGTKHLKKKRF